MHTSANDVPPEYTLLAVEVRDDVSLEEWDVKTLSSDWRERTDITQEIGSAWLHSGRAALLRVPSALVPATFNVLLNPLHVEAAHIRIQSAINYPFDSRIKR